MAEAQNSLQQLQLTSSNDGECVVVFQLHTLPKHMVEQK